MSTLPPPVNVSPLIKFARWSLLSAGVFYGAFNKRRLSEKEAALREIRAQEKAEQAAIMEAEKKAASELELKVLAEAFSK